VPILNYDSIDRVVSNQLRWKLFYQIQFGNLVKAWYHDKRPDLTEPMNFTEEAIQEAYTPIPATKS
jgi:hypothetical protein